MTVILPEIGNFIALNNAISRTTIDKFVRAECLYRVRNLGKIE